MLFSSPFLYADPAAKYDIHLCPSSSFLQQFLRKEDLVSAVICVDCLLFLSIFNQCLCTTSKGKVATTSTRNKRVNVCARRVTESLFMDEDIGAEHGEGFETFRPCGPLKVDVDYLNDRMRESGLQRIRYAMKPDEAFGLIYSWDNVLAETRKLRLDAWKQLALEEGKIWHDDQDTQRYILNMGIENALRKVLSWNGADGSLDHFKVRLAKIYYEKLSKVRTPREGLKEWLDALQTAGVPCAVASSLDRFNLLAALQRMGLYKYFQAVITREDGMDSIAEGFLSAAVKLDRAPSKCVVFEDDPRGITAAHNCSMKAVALIGSHPAYELTQADLAVSSFSELSVINLRRLFANKGTEFMDLQKQLEERKPLRRKIITDTIQ